MISEKKGEYPFIIAKTSSSDKSGTHWWSIMDIKPQVDFFILFIWHGWFKKLHNIGR